MARVPGQPNELGACLLAAIWSVRPLATAGQTRRRPRYSRIISPQPRKRPSRPRPDKPKSQAKGKVQEQPQAKAEPGAIRPASTWAGRSPTSCPGRVPTGSFARRAIDEEQPEAMLDALKIPRARPWPTSAPAPAITASAWPGGSGPGDRSWPPTFSPRCCGCSSERAGGRRHQHQADPRHPERHQAPRGRRRPDPDGRRLPRVLRPRDHPARALEGPEAPRPAGPGRIPRRRPQVPIKPEHKMTLEQVRREVEPQGFTFKESLEFLPWQHVIIFEKPAEAASPTTREKPRHAAQPNAEPRPGRIARSEFVQFGWYSRVSGVLFGSSFPAQLTLFGAHDDGPLRWIWKRRNTSSRSLRRPSIPAAQAADVADRL